LQVALTRLDRFGTAAVLTGILLSVAVVLQNLVVLASAIVLALASLLPVEMSLGIFALLVPFDYVLAIGHHDSAIRVTWLAGAFAGSVLLFYGLVTERLKRPPLTALFWVLFMCWVGLSSFWSIDPVVSAQRIPSVVTFLALYLVTVSFHIKPQELSRVLSFAIFGGALAALVLIYQVSRGGVQPSIAHYVAEGRGALVFGEWESNPNEFGASLVLPFSLGFVGILSRGAVTKKVILVIAVMLSACGIFLTMSRGATIALAVAVLVILYRFGVRTRVLVPLALALIPLLFVPNLFYERLMEAPSGRGTGRLDILFVGLEIIKHNPLLGTGMATFPIAYDQYAGYAPVFHGYNWSSHDTYLQAWAETGIIGFVLLLSAIVFQLKTVRGALRDVGANHWSGIAVEAAFLGVLVHAFSGDLEFNKCFWFILMVLSLIAQPRSKLQMQ
jgi:putative inorganic carbon (hco3(-)) transporter